jgi:hypothetical protein
MTSTAPESARWSMTEMVDDVVAQVFGHPVGVPDRAGQQMLHAVGRGVADVLGDRPGVLARQIGQQPEQEPADPPPQLHPTEPARDPLGQLIHARRPAGRPYPGPRDHRGTVRCPHT